MKIYTDDEVFVQIKEKSRQAYIKSWQDFKSFCPDHEFENGYPPEEIFIKYFNHLKLDKKMATSSLWTHYSYLNSVMKRKYGFKMQDNPRITMLIKGFEAETTKKAAIFEVEDLERFWAMKVNTAFWEVRQAVALTAYFGGLRMIECMNLALEQIVRGPDGFTITHTRAKQRSDKVTTKFMVVGVYAHVLAMYLDKVNNQLEKYKGRVWYTGKKSDSLSNQHMGKNSISKIPHEIASLLNLPDPARYTFHSFRRTSATNAADAGATTEQLVDFYGWKNSSMCKEYISSSKPAILGMANRLSVTDKEAMTEPKIQESNQDLFNGDTGIENVITTLLQEDPNLDALISEMENEDMFLEAGIPLATQQSGFNVQQGCVEASIKQAISALPAARNGANIELKVIVVNNMPGNINL